MLPLSSPPPPLSLSCSSFTIIFNMSHSPLLFFLSCSFALNPCSPSSGELQHQFNWHRGPMKYKYPSLSLAHSRPPSLSHLHSKRERRTLMSHRPPACLRLTDCRLLFIYGRDWALGPPTFPPPSLQTLSPLCLFFLLNLFHSSPYFR